MKDVRCELAQIIYDREIYPKNLYLDREPMKHAEYKEKIIDRQIALMQDMGAWKKPTGAEKRPNRTAKKTKGAS